MWREDKVTYKVIDTLGVIDQRTDRKGVTWTREVNIVSWNDHEPKVDIREWDEDHTQMKKGITLTFEEADKVAEILTAFAQERA